MPLRMGNLLSNLIRESLLRCSGMRLASVLLLPSKGILQGSSETKPWLKAGFGVCDWLWGVLRDGGKGFRVTGMGDPCEVSQKCQLSYKSYFPAPSALCYPPSPQVPRVL